MLGGKGVGGLILGGRDCLTVVAQSVGSYSSVGAHSVGAGALVGVGAGVWAWALAWSWPHQPNIGHDADMT